MGVTILIIFVAFGVLFLLVGQIDYLEFEYPKRLHKKLFVTFGKYEKKRHRNRISFVTLELTPLAVGWKEESFVHVNEFACKIHCKECKVKVDESEKNFADYFTIDFKDNLVEITASESGFFDIDHITLDEGFLITKREKNFGTRRFAGFHFLFRLFLFAIFLLNPKVKLLCSNFYYITYRLMASKVYFTKEITPESLIRIYEKLGVELTGKVGVKVSTGERGSKGYLKADLIAPLVKKLNGTIIECNTAYDGARNTAEDHMKVAEEHGFTSFADVDIMDADGEFKIPVKNGKHLKYDIVGENFKNYDSILNLAHGKGHIMGGFGANLKNQSIGIASRNGKAYIHSCGQTEDPDECWKVKFEQGDFIESMAEAATAVADYLKENNKPIVYITVANAISLDCDCDAHQGDPVIADIGIFGSLDPVANDQAFIDAIRATHEEGTKDIQERIDTRKGRHITEYAEELGLGSTDYELLLI